MSASESPNHQISAVNAANCPINIAIRPRPRVAHRPQGFTVQIPTALPLRVDQAADAGIRRKSSYVAILPAIRKGNGRFACSSQWRSQLRLAPAMHTRRTTCLRLLRPRRQRQRQRLPAIFRRWSSPRHRTGTIPFGMRLAAFSQQSSSDSLLRPFRLTPRRRRRRVPCPPGRPLLSFRAVCRVLARPVAEVVPPVGAQEAVVVFQPRQGQRRVSHPWQR